jgi:adenylate cyclase
VSAVKKRRARRRAAGKRGDVATLVIGAVQAGMQATAKARELAPQVKDSIQSIVTWVDASRPSVRSGIGADGTVTLLFSDIENSTAINARLGDAQWMDALRAHTKLVHAAVDTHRGQVVKSQGDGFMVAFRQPVEAVRCAIDVQRALHDEPGGEPLRIRVGIHTGAAIKEDGDFFGANVAYAARVAQHARGGQILVSEAV